MNAPLGIPDRPEVRVRLGAKGEFGHYEADFRAWMN